MIKVDHLGEVPSGQRRGEGVNNMISVSIIGGSGYAGGELLRILNSHPKVKIKQVTSRQFAKQPVSLAHPNLRGKTNLMFSTIDELTDCDLLFISLPNGESMKLMDRLIKISPRIIDLGADFRLRTPLSWLKWYGVDHQAPGLISRFIYGLPELKREKIKKANFIAGPGCEAIVSILSLWPLVKNEVIERDKIIIDAKMGSSQAGRKATSSTHHPERVGVVRSYSPVGHRHTAEIEQELGQVKVLISATAVEMVRGILVTIQTFLKKDLSEKDIWKLYRQEYSSEPFIRLVKQRQGLYRYPEPKILQGTNICEIGFAKDPHSNRLVVIGAIDNLVKGTAGNAVQCMNLMFGFEETEGLDFVGLHPI